jgi:methionine biosynthesis protein MetW
MLDGPYVRGTNRRVEGAARRLLGGGRLLDLGCGAGVLAEVIGSRYAEIHGLDLSERAVGAAVHRGMRALTWDLNDAPLPYPDEFFDAVTALSVLQYVVDPVALVREAARVVRPGGQVCLGCPNVRAMWRLVRLAVLGRFPRVTRDSGYDGGTIHYFCRRDVDALLTEAGLDVQASVGVFSWPAWLEARGDFVPAFAGLKREFLSGEVLVVGRKRVGPS